MGARKAELISSKLSLIHKLSHYYIHFNDLRADENKAEERIKAGLLVLDFVYFVPNILSSINEQYK